MHTVHFSVPISSVSNGLIQILIQLATDASAYRLGQIYIKDVVMDYAG